MLHVLVRFLLMASLSMGIVNNTYVLNMSMMYTHTRALSVCPRQTDRQRERERERERENYLCVFSYFWFEIYKIN